MAVNYQAQSHDQLLGAASGRSEAALAEALSELQLLDEAALRRRWRSLVGSLPPTDLGRPLTLRVLAYKLQAQRLGDLDKASLRELAALVSRHASKAPADNDGKVLSRSIKNGGTDPIAPTTPTHAKPRPLARPGTVLVREHAGVRHRVMVLDEGVTWNGRTYESLSKVAFAITGTRWNGPRFFGLRDKAIKEDSHSADHRRDDKGKRARSIRRITAPAQGLSPAQARP
jgi:hypothetical protein